MEMDPVKVALDVRKSKKIYLMILIRRIDNYNPNLAIVLPVSKERLMKKDSDKIFHNTFSKIIDSLKIIKPFIKKLLGKRLMHSNILNYTKYNFREIIKKITY